MDNLRNSQTVLFIGHQGIRPYHKPHQKLVRTDSKVQSRHRAERTPALLREVLASVPGESAEGESQLKILRQPPGSYLRGAGNGRGSCSQQLGGSGSLVVDEEVHEVRIRTGHSKSQLPQIRVRFPPPGKGSRQLVHNQGPRLRSNNTPNRLNHSTHPKRVC